MGRALQLLDESEMELEDITAKECTAFIDGPLAQFSSTSIPHFPYQPILTHARVGRSERQRTVPVRVLCTAQEVVGGLEGPGVRGRGERDDHSGIVSPAFSHPIFNSI